ncbi:MAG: hypothetical protein AB7V16_13250 [Vulcanibacillus sp.]
MKKLITLFMLATLFVFGFSFSTKAEDQVVSIHTWTPYIYYSTYWAMELEVDINDVGNSYLHFEIPAAAQNVYEVGGTDGYINFYFTNGTLDDSFSIPLEDYIYYNFGTSSTYLQTNDVEADFDIRCHTCETFYNAVDGTYTLQDIKDDFSISDYYLEKIIVRVPQNVAYSSGEGVTATNYWLANTYNVLYSSGLVLEFYNASEMISREVVYRDYISTADLPADPTPPANYDFAGWRIDIADELLSNYLGNGSSIYFPPSTWVEATDIGTGFDVLIFRASFISETDLGYTTPVITDTAPEEFGNILSVIGFNNSAGHMLIYIILAILLIVFFAVFKLPLIMHFIALTAETIIFITIGWLPLHVAIIIIMALIITFFAMNRGGAYE